MSKILITEYTRQWNGLNYEDTIYRERFYLKGYKFTSKLAALNMVEALAKENESLCKPAGLPVCDFRVVQDSHEIKPPL